MLCETCCENKPLNAFKANMSLNLTECVECRNKTNQNNYKDDSDFMVKKDFILASLQTRPKKIVEESVLEFLADFRKN